MVAQYAPDVTQWLREDPDLSGVENPAARPARRLSRRKSALYELVKRLRGGRPVNQSRRSLQKGQ